MKHVDILVSIVNWNSGTGLRECVKSFYNLLSGFDKSFIIKIYDNNSTDNSLQLEIDDKERIAIIRGRKNEGLKSHEYNLHDTIYDFLIISNSDILFKKGDFRKFWTFINENVKVSVVGFSIYKADETRLNRVFHLKGFPSFTEWFIQKSLFRFMFVAILRCLGSKTPDRIKSALHRQDISSFENPTRVARVSGCVFITRRSVVIQIGLFDPNFFMYAETIDFLKRVNSIEGEVFYYPHISFTHHGGLSNCKRSGINIQHNMSYFYYYKKHFGIAYAYSMSLIIFFDLCFRFLLIGLFRAHSLIPKHSTMTTLKEDILYWLNKIRFYQFSDSPYHPNDGD